MEQEVKVPKFAIVPAEFQNKSKDKYLVAGERFEIIDSNLILNTFSILDRQGEFLICLTKNCCHLDGLDWILE
jgi:hypothetical protein